jgi:hypothetical protein
MSNSLDELRASTDATLHLRETIMVGQSVVRNLVKLGLVALFGISTVILDSQSSFADKGGGCGAGCRSRLCSDLVKQKGLKGDGFKAEFGKCKMDPVNYK